MNAMLLVWLITMPPRNYCYCQRILRNHHFKTWKTLLGFLYGFYMMHGYFYDYFKNLEDVVGVLQREVRDCHLFEKSLLVWEL